MKVYAQGVEKKGQLGIGPITSWRVERRRVRRFLLLGGTGEVWRVVEMWSARCSVSLSRRDIFDVFYEGGVIR